MFQFLKAKLMSSVLRGAGLLSVGAVAVITGADETTGTKDPAPISEVKVTATRLSTEVSKVPASVSVVDKKSIQLGRQQLGLDESLLGIAGVFIQDRYNFAQDLRIAIRGFGARSNFGIRGVKIVVDGIPETLPDGQGQIDAIDIGSIEQIEVIKGPASSLYGNASGGVINIVSEQGPPQPFVETRLALGADEFAKYQIKAGGDSGRVNYLFDISRLTYDGYREHSETENTQLNGRLKFKLSDYQNLSVVLNASDQPIANDPGGVTLSDAQLNPRAARLRNVEFDSGESLDQQKFGLVYTHQLSPAQSLTVRGYSLWRDFANKLPFVGGGAVKIDRQLTGGGVLYTYDAQSRKNHSTKTKHRLLLGIDIDRQDDERQRFDNQQGVLGDLAFDQNETVDNIGLFVQNEFTLSESLALTAGIRFDRIKFAAADRFVTDGDDSGGRSLSEFSPMIGAVYTPMPQLAIYANYATSFETPTTTEFANPDGSGGFNTALQPQLAKSFELGIKATPNAMNSVDLALFRIDVEDELVPFELASQPGRDFFTNAGASERVGVELSWLVKPIEELTFALAYTYSDFTFKQFVDDNNNNFAANPLPGIPTNQLFAELKYLDEKGRYVSIDMLDVGAVSLNNANTVSNDSYSVVNARAGLQFELSKLQLTPFVGINNLSNESYFGNVRINAFGGRYYEPAPERNFYAGVGLKYSFK